MKPQILRISLNLLFLSCLFFGVLSPSYGAHILTEAALRDKSSRVFKPTSDLHKVAVISGDFVDTNLPSGYEFSFPSGSSFKPSEDFYHDYRSMPIDSDGTLEIKGEPKPFTSRPLQLDAKKIILSDCIHINRGAIIADTLEISEHAKVSLGYGVNLKIKHLIIKGSLQAQGFYQLESLNLGAQASLKAKQIKFSDDESSNSFKTFESSELVCDTLYYLGKRFSLKGKLTARNAHLELNEGAFEDNSQLNIKDLFLTSNGEVTFRKCKVFTNKLVFLGKKVKLSSYTSINAKESINGVLEALELKQTTLNAPSIELNNRKIKIDQDVEFYANSLFLEGRGEVGLYGQQNKIVANSVYADSYQGDIYSAFEFRLNPDYSDEQVRQSFLSKPKLLNISNSIDPSYKDSERPSLFFLRSGKGDIYLDSKRVPHKMLGLESNQAVNLASKLRLDPSAILGIKASKFELGRKLELSKINIQTINQLNLFQVGSLSADSITLYGGVVNLDGDIETSNLEVFGKEKLIIGPSAIKTVKAALGSGRYLNLRQLSQLKVIEQLEIKNDEQRLVLSGAITASLIDILAQNVHSSKSSKIEKAERFSSESVAKTLLSGKVGLKKGGEVYIKGSEVGLENARVSAPKAEDGDKEAKLYMEATKGSVKLKHTVLDGIDQLDFKAKDSIVLAKDSRIEDAKNVTFTAKQVDLDGTIKADQVTATAGKINYRGRIIDANNVDFFSDESIDIATYALLQVTHRLRLHSKAKVSIAGSVLSKVLDICATEFHLLRSGDLTADQKAIIYTYAWSKMEGLVDFAKADASINAGTSVTIDNTFLYKNLEVAGLDGKELESIMIGKDGLLIDDYKIKDLSLGKDSNWLEKRLLEHKRSSLNPNKPEDLATMIANEMSTPEWREMALPLFMSLSSNVFRSYIDKVRSGFFHFCLEVIKGSLDNTGAATILESAKLLTGKNWQESLKKLGSGAVKSFKSQAFDGFWEQVWKIPLNSFMASFESSLSSTLMLSARYTLQRPPMSKDQFISKLSIILGAHSDTTINSKIMEALGLGFLNVKITQDNGPRTRPQPNQLELHHDTEADKKPLKSKLVFKAKSVDIGGVISANKLDIVSKDTYIQGSINTQLTKIVSDYIELAKTGKMKFSERCSLEAHIEAILRGQIIGGERAITVDDNFKVKVNEKIHDAYLEIITKNLLSTANIDVQGEIKIDAKDGSFHLGKHGSIKALRLSIDAAEARLDGPIEVIDAFYNVYNKIQFGKLDNFIVKNYLKINAPNGKVEIDAKLMANVIDICAEEFFLLRSGILSADEHALIESKVHTVIDGLLESRKGSIEISGEKADLDITGHIDAADSLKMLAKNIRTWRKDNNRPQIEAEDIYADVSSGTFELSETDLMAKRVLDIKGKRFWQIAESHITGKELKLDLEEDVYVGCLSSMKAEQINIKSHVFTNLQGSLLKGNSVVIDSDQQNIMGSLMADNIILSSKLLTMGSLGILMGNNIQVSSHGVFMGGGAAITGTNVSVSSTGTVTAGMGAAIVGAWNTTISTGSLIMGPGTFIGGTRVNLLAPVVLMAPGSMMFGGISFQGEGLYAYGADGASISTGTDQLGLDFFEFDLSLVGSHDNDAAANVAKLTDSFSVKSIFKSTASWLTGSKPKEPSKKGTPQQVTLKARGTAKIRGKAFGRNLSVSGKVVKTFMGSEISAKESVTLGVGSLAEVQGSIKADHVQAMGLAPNSRAEILIKSEGSINAQKVLSASNLAKLHVAEGATIASQDITQIVDVGHTKLEGELKTRKGYVETETYESTVSSNVHLHNGATPEDDKSPAASFVVAAHNIDAKGTGTDDGTCQQSLRQYEHIATEDGQTGQFNFGVYNQGQGQTVLSTESRVTLSSSTPQGEVGGGDKFYVDAGGLDTESGTSQVAKDLVSNRLVEKSKITHDQKARHIHNEAKEGLEVNNTRTLLGSGGRVTDMAGAGKDVKSSGTIHNADNATVVIGSTAGRSSTAENLNVQGQAEDLIVISQNASRAENVSTGGRLTARALGKNGTATIRGPHSQIGGDAYADSRGKASIDGLGSVGGNTTAVSHDHEASVSNIKKTNGSVYARGHTKATVTKVESKKTVGAFALGNDGQAEVTDSSARDLKAFGQKRTEVSSTNIGNSVQAGYLSVLGEEDARETIRSQSLSFKNNNYQGSSGDNEGQNVSLAGKTIDESNNTGFEQASEVNVYAGEVISQNDDSTHPSMLDGDNAMIDADKITEGKSTNLRYSRVQKQFSVNNQGYLTRSALSEQEKAEMLKDREELKKIRDNYEYDKMIAARIENDQKTVLLSGKEIKQKSGSTVDLEGVEHLSFNADECFIQSEDSRLKSKKVTMFGKDVVLGGVNETEELFLANADGDLTQGEKGEIKSAVTMTHSDGNSRFAGKTAGEEAYTSANEDLEYTETSDTRLERHNMNAHNIKREGRHKAKFLDESAEETVHHGSKLHQIIDSDGDHQVEAKRFRQDKGAKEELGTGAKVFISGIPEYSKSEDGKTIKIAKKKADEVTLNGAFKGGPGSLVKVYTKKLQGEGSIEAEKAFSYVDELLFNGSIHTTMENHLSVSDWRTNDIKLSSDKQLKLFLAEQIKEIDFSEMRAGEGIFVMGNLSNDSWLKLFEGQDGKLHGNLETVVLSPTISIHRDLNFANQVKIRNYTKKSENPEEDIATPLALNIDPHVEIKHKGLEVYTSGDICIGMGASIEGTEGGNLKLRSSHGNIKIGMLKDEEGNFVTYEAEMVKRFKKFEEDVAKNELEYQKRKKNYWEEVKKAGDLIIGKQTESEEGNCAVRARKRLWNSFKKNLKRVFKEAARPLAPKAPELKLADQPQYITAYQTNITGDGDIDIQTENGHIFANGAKIISQANLIIKSKGLLVVTPISYYTFEHYKVPKNAGFMEQHYIHKREFREKAELGGMQSLTIHAENDPKLLEAMISDQDDEETRERIRALKPILQNVELRGNNRDIGVEAINSELDDVYIKHGKKILSQNGRNVVMAAKLIVTAVSLYYSVPAGAAFGNTVGGLITIGAIGTGHTMIDYGVNQAEARGKFDLERHGINNLKGAALSYFFHKAGFETSEAIQGKNPDLIEKAAAKFAGRAIKAGVMEGFRRLQYPDESFNAGEVLADISIPTLLETGLEYLDVKDLWKEYSDAEFGFTSSSLPDKLFDSAARVGVDVASPMIKDIMAGKEINFEDARANAINAATEAFVEAFLDLFKDVNNELNKQNSAPQASTDDDHHDSLENPHDSSNGNNGPSNNEADAGEKSSNPNRPTEEPSPKGQNTIDSDTGLDTGLDPDFVTDNPGNLLEKPRETPKKPGNGANLSPNAKSSVPVYGVNGKELGETLLDADNKVVGQRQYPYTYKDSNGQLHKQEQGWFYNEEGMLIKYRATSDIDENGNEHNIKKEIIPIQPSYDNDGILVNRAPRPDFTMIDHDLDYSPNNQMASTPDTPPLPEPDEAMGPQLSDLDRKLPPIPEGDEEDQGFIGRNLGDLVKDMDLDHACFVKGTRVAVAGGAKTIETLKKGDMVWSCNGDRCELQPVEEGAEEPTGYEQLWQVSTSSGMYWVTGNHPFYVKGYASDSWSEDNFVAVDELETGFVLLNASGLEETVEEVHLTDDWEYVYNIKVKTNHNYYVGDASSHLSRFILVHNCDLAEAFGKGAGEVGEKWKRIAEHAVDYDYSDLPEDLVKKFLEIRNSYEQVINNPDKAYDRAKQQVQQQVQQLLELDLSEAYQGWNEMSDVEKAYQFGKLSGEVVENYAGGKVAGGVLKAVGAAVPPALGKPKQPKVNGGRPKQQKVRQDKRKHGGEPNSITGLEATKVTPKGLERIEKHLFETKGIEAGGAERHMIERLRAGKREPQDLKFFQHEIKESRIIKKYEKLGLSPEEAARRAHREALQRQDLYRPGNLEELYHPDALKIMEKELMQ